MVLNQLKGRLKTAAGHKLLKDKRDELMRQFMDVVKLNKQLRTRVEEGLTEPSRPCRSQALSCLPRCWSRRCCIRARASRLGMDF